MHDIRFEKQEVGRDLYNIAGDIVFQHPITQKSIKIFTIQSVLKKGETSKGDFFKKEPDWVDFEQGYIIERREVDEIIEKLETEKIQLVLGDPASGKTVILKNIGFKLSNKKIVYYVELKKHTRDGVKLFFENIPKIKNAIFIIDDAHLYISDCERLIRDFRSSEKGNLIIGSRKTKEITEERLKESSEFEYLSKTSIRSEDVTEEMIKTFLKRLYHFDEDKIKTISRNLGRYKKDLWFLSWALKVYNPTTNLVKEDEISEKIKKIIRSIKAEYVFLPLSIFFKFEIPVEQKFLERQLGIKKETIEPLIGNCEVVKTEEKGKSVMLSLNHSSLAELYFRAYQDYPSLGEEIKEKILNKKNEKYLEYCFFHRYLTTTDPRNAVEIVCFLGRNNWNKKVRKLIKKLVEEKNIQKSIEKGIYKEEDMGKIGRCISNIAKANNEVALRLVDSVLSKIDKEEDIVSIGMCIGEINLANEKVALKLVKSINIEALSSKIDKEKDMEKIRWLIFFIPSQKVALKLDLHALSSKIDNEENIELIAACISNIAKANNEVALKLIESINIEALSSKIDKEKDIELIGMCVSDIRFLSEEVAMKLVDNIDHVALSSKIDKEDNIDLIGYCISDIAFVNKEVALKLVERINIDALSIKINEKEKDIMTIGDCISEIALVSEEVAQKLIDNIDHVALSSKIDDEEKIWAIGSGIFNITSVNKELASKLLDQINIDALSSKMDKEEDIEFIKEFISIIAQTNKEVAIKIINHLNPKRRKEL